MKSFLAARADHFARTRPQLVDRLVALTAWLLTAVPGAWVTGTTGLLIGTATVLPLAFRRRFPRTVLAVSAVTFALQLSLLAVPLPANLAQAIIVYTVAAHVPSLAARLTGLGLAVAGCLVAGFRWSTPPLYLANAIGIGVFLAVLSVLLWVTGNLVRGRAANLRALAETRRQNERLAAAREIHNLVAHSLTVVVVQADAGAFGDPRAALTAIGTTARSALADVREVIETLREPAPVAEPGVALDDVERIADLVRAAGVPVRVSADPGALTRLPPALLRVIREALTNVVKHAGPGAAATVDIRRAAGALRIQIDDDGSGGDRPSGGDWSGGGDRSGGDWSGGDWSGGGYGSGGPVDAATGVGIAGMSERLRELDGTLRAGPLPGRGFRVEAVVPAVFG
ncbi:hypothetical protein KOI35_30930 [Actinoplanes bogorensis]|uniref:histidine kinase n=1 Tax=Paractinoplanes bogorensis TaxID=1610840 RepID=A0ABS5Z0L4_9ACTN|nr:ATP-binding protein [Actinoplanes bogorensis]MBU2667935.1 hypothetical protein [Actinoplanes bogorensis]